MSPAPLPPPRAKRILASKPASSALGPASPGGQGRSEGPEDVSLGAAARASPEAARGWPESPWPRAAQRTRWTQRVWTGCQEPLFAVQESFREEKAPGHIPPLAALTAPSAHAARHTTRHGAPAGHGQTRWCTCRLRHPARAPRRTKAGSLGVVIGAEKPRAPHIPHGRGGSRGCAAAGRRAGRGSQPHACTAARGRTSPPPSPPTGPQSSLEEKDARPGPGASQWLLKPKDVRGEDWVGARSPEF